MLNSLKSKQIEVNFMQVVILDAVCGNAESIRISLGSPVSIPCPLKDLSGSDVTIDSRKWCINNCDSNLNVKAESSDPSPFRWNWNIFKKIFF